MLLLDRPVPNASTWSFQDRSVDYLTVPYLRSQTGAGTELGALRRQAELYGRRATTPKKIRRPNDTLAKLQATPHASGDAARPLPRLKMYSEEVICNGRDAVANESAEALQRRASIGGLPASASS